MKIQERSFGGVFFRPRPEIFLDSSNLLIVATPWGLRKTATEAIQIIADYYLSANDDGELTSPFGKLSCLNTTLNNLRTSVLLANETLYQRVNSHEYRSGLELFVCSLVSKELQWVQVGHPQLFLFRDCTTPVPLGSSIDFSLELSSETKLLPPLPRDLIGVDTSANLILNSFRPRKSDKIALLSRSTVPVSFFNCPGNLDSISQVLSSDDADLPFWLGLIEF